MTIVVLRLILSTVVIFGTQNSKRTRSKSVENTMPIWVIDADKNRLSHPITECPNDYKA